MSSQKRLGEYLAWAFFYFHLTIFIGINAFLIITNYIHNPQTPWFIIPLSFWGIFLFIHYLIQFFMVSESARSWRDSKRAEIIPRIAEKGLSQEELRKRASVKLFNWLAVSFHTYTWIAAGFIMLLINYLISKRIDWSLIVIATWSIWLFIHYVFIFVLFDERLYAWRQIKRKSFQATDDENRLYFGFWLAFQFHLTLYILANALMIVMDLRFNTAGPHWFMYPAISWGIILLAHGLLTYLVISPKVNKWHKQNI